MQLFFRFDDITGLSSLDLEKQLFEIFKDCKMVCSVAVVPMVTARNFEEQMPAGNIPLCKEKILFLQSTVQQGTFDVLLHGYSHQAFKLYPLPSEFAGRPIVEQERLLVEGREILKKAIGVDVSCFVPPWNTYDRNTLTCLIKSGFKGVSTNSDGPVAPGISYVQYTTDIKGLRRAVQLARESKASRLIIGVLLHPYDFTESGSEQAMISVGEMAGELAWVADQADISVVSVSQLIADNNTDVGPERFKANKAGFWESVNPPFLDKLRKSQVYWPIKIALLNKAIRLGGASCFYFATFLIGFAMAGGLTHALGYIGLPVTVLLIVVCAAIALLIGRWIRDEIIYFKPFLVTVLLTGVLTGLIF